MQQLNEFFTGLFRSLKRKQEDSASRTWTGAVSRDIAARECPFAVFDTELSGLNARKDFIVSVGAVKMKGGTIQVSEKFYRLVRPRGKMTGTSVVIHGITPDELSDVDEMGSVLPEFLSFITDSVLVGHFVHIDIKFVNEALKRRGLGKLNNPAIDTHSLHEWLLQNSRTFKGHYHGGSGKTDLFSLAERYRIPVAAAHNALSDAFITAQLFQQFMYFLHAEGMQTLNDLIDIGRA